MKKLLIILFLLSAQFSFGQSKNEFYITYGISSAVPTYGIKNDMDGAPGYSGKGTSSLGLRFLLKSKSVLRLETGAEYIRCQFDVTPSFYPGNDQTPKKNEVRLISVPVYANLTFLKYCFVQGGVLADFEVNRESNIQKQTGLGFGLGVGGKYAFRKVSIMVNPFLQRHALIAGKDGQGTRESLINAGVRLGIGYLF